MLIINYSSECNVFIIELYLFFLILYALFLLNSESIKMIVYVKDFVGKFFSHIFVMDDIVKELSV